MSSIRDYLKAGPPAPVALALVLLYASCAPRSSAKLTIAAAADLQFAMREVVRQFHGAHPGIDTQIVYGSSGNFYSQIRNQAPFDVFISADLEYPMNLVQEGLADGGSLFRYAVGRLAVWVPAESALDVTGLGMKVLEQPSVKHVAIANPAHAPYGKAAEAALREAGVYDAVAGKLVVAENIAQTLQFVQSGAAEAGIVALSLAIAPEVRSKGRYWEVPLEWYPRMWQAAVILKRTKNHPAADTFLAFLTGASGRQILQQYGFSLPVN